MRKASLIYSFFWVIPLITLASCANKIGDSCESSIGCSPNGDRLCDIAQPGGYCTVQGCDANTCPDNAVCVTWRGDPPRTAENWCMKRCNGSGDCRGEYQCTLPSEVTDEEGSSIAQALRQQGVEEDEPRICIATPDA